MLMHTLKRSVIATQYQTTGLGASGANVTQRGEGGVGSMGGLLERIHVEEVECLQLLVFAEGLGVRLEPRGSRMSWYSLMA